MGDNVMDGMISFSDIVSIFKSKIKWLIVSLVFTSAGLLVVTNLFIEPRYSATTELALGINNSKQASLNDVNFNLVMMNTYESLIKSAAVLSEIQQTHADVSVTELQKMVHVITEESSQIFSIQTTMNDPQKAAEISNQIAEIFQTKAKDILDSQQKISIITPAEVPSTAVFPNQKMMIALGILLGFILWFLAIVINLTLDKTIKSEDYVKDQLGIKYLGKVGRITANDTRRRKH